MLLCVQNCQEVPLGSSILVFYHKRLLGAPWGVFHPSLLPQKAPGCTLGGVTKPVVSPVMLVPLIMMMMMMMMMMIMMTRNSDDADKTT